MKRRIVAASALLMLLALPAAANAQIGIFLGGGATLPQGDYGEYASTGWMGHLGVLVPISSAPGLGVVGVASYGSNNHEFDGDKTNLFGAQGGLSYRLGNPERTGIFFFGLGGYLNHQYRSEEFPEDEGSEGKFAYTGGVGVEIPLSGLSLWFDGAYTGRGDTKFFGINAGVTILVGGGGGM